MIDVGQVKRHRWDLVITVLTVSWPCDSASAVTARITEGTTGYGYAVFLYGRAARYTETTPASGAVARRWSPARRARRYRLPDAGSRSS